MHVCLDVSPTVFIGVYSLVSMFEISAQDLMGLMFKHVGQDLHYYFKMVYNSFDNC